MNSKAKQDKHRENFRSNHGISGSLTDLTFIDSISGYFTDNKDVKFVFNSVVGHLHCTIINGHYKVRLSDIVDITPGKVFHIRDGFFNYNDLEKLWLSGVKIFLLNTCSVWINFDRAPNKEHYNAISGSICDSTVTFQGWLKNAQRITDIFDFLNNTPRWSRIIIEDYPELEDVLNADSSIIQKYAAAMDCVDA